MTNLQIIELAKFANAMGASPDQFAQGMQEHGQEMSPDEAGGVMQDASQIDPAELQALQQQFPGVDEHELAQIAQFIEEYMAQQEGGGQGGGQGGQEGLQLDPTGGAPQGADPGAMGAGGGGGMPPGMEEMMQHGKMGSDQDSIKLAQVRSAPYIFGFLKTAVENGFSVKEAVDFYGDRFSATKEAIKEAKEFETKMASVIDNVDDKTAAYLEGVFKQAEDQGLSFHETAALLKESGQLDNILKLSK